MIKIVTTSHRGRALKNAIANRINPEFVEDLALNPEQIREGAYARITDVLYRKKLRAAVAAYIEEHHE